MGSTGRLEGCPGKLAGRVQEGFPDGIAGCWKLQLFKDYAPPPNQKGRVQIASNGLKTQHMQEIEGILNSASLP